METKIREFHAKTLLACVAAEKGFTVILGEQERLRLTLPKLPGGIYIAKDVVPKKQKIFRDYVAMGHKIVAWCEEGLVFNSKESYVRRRVSQKVFEAIDIFFAWGDYQKKTIVDYLPEAEKKIVLLGNPRLDLLRPPLRPVFAEDVRVLREKYGAFILVNTNFGKYNHFFSKEHLLKTWRQKGRIKNQQDENFFLGWIDFAKKMFESFAAFIPQLSVRYPGHTIIVRPHPSENHQAWIDTLQGCRNVKVIHDGNVIPWLLAADCLIHNSCTTGIEAYLCGKPAIAFCPVAETRFASELPNEVSRKVYSEDELFAAVDAVIADPLAAAGVDAGDRYCQEYISRYITGVGGRLTCDRTVDRLLDLIDRQRCGTPVGLAGILTALQYRLINRAKKIKRGVLGKWGVAKEYKDYHRQKFPSCSLEEVNEQVTAFSMLLDRFHDLQVTPLKNVEFCYVIKKSST